MRWCSPKNTLSALGMAALTTLCSAGFSAHIPQNAQMDHDRWRVAIHNFSDLVCRGAFIFEDAVLTAAGCVSGSSPSEVAVRTGIYNEDIGGRHLDVAKIQTHPLYNADTGAYNVAVLRLHGITPFTPDAQTIDATLKGVMIDLGRVGIVSGHDTKMNHLRALTATIGDHLDCVNNYAVSMLPLTDPTFGGAGYFDGLAGVCELRAGGPLVDRYGDVFMGMASSHCGCGALGKPGEYTSIEAVSDWILWAMSA